MLTDSVILASFLIRWHILAGASLAASVFLVERRGRREKLDPNRQVEINSILEAIPEAALVLDARGHIVDANSSAAALIGLSRDRLAHSPVTDLTRVSAPGQPPSFDAAHTIFHRALRGEEVRNQHRQLHNPNRASALEVLVSANPVRNANGEIIGVLVIARDITEMSQLQRRIGDIERHHAIGQMAAALAHDFNNVLDAIGQAAALLQSNQTEESERQSLLSLIRSSVQRGAEIIARIREYLRTGKSAQGPVDVRQVLEETVQLTRPLWQRAGIRLEKKLKPVGCIMGNAADVRRVFANLIINAIEAMPHGGRITASCGEEEGRVVAEIADTGQGIPDEEKKKIFYAYHTTKAGGTGLGLSGAQKIILAQGGHISFESEVGKGTRFRIDWPVARGVNKPSNGNGSHRDSRVA